jgi:hypothetical protein
VRATQAGDVNFSAATPVDRSFVTTKASAGIAINSSPNPSMPAQEVTFSGTVSAAAPGNGAPTGSVQFSGNGSALGGPVSLTNGAASLTASLSQHGTNTITVTYSGDEFFNGNTNALNPPQIVNRTPVAGDDAVQRYQGQGVKVLASTLLANDTDADGDGLTVTGVNSNSAAGGLVSLQEGWIFYSPPAGLTNSDSFTYLVSDVFGGAAQGTIAVAVITNTAPTDNLVIESLGSGSFRVLFDGMPGQSYQIQYTPSLENPSWQTLATTTADSLGRYEYVDMPPSGLPRIYRSVAQ